MQPEQKTKNTEITQVQHTTLPIRLMVGLWFLVPAIGVRVPDRQLLAQITREGDFAFELPDSE